MGDPQVQSTEEAPGPPAECERLQRKSTSKFNGAIKKVKRVKSYVTSRFKHIVIYF
jgi:hypothetical protein